jgi:hypothetical protein
MVLYPEGDEMNSDHHEKFNCHVQVIIPLVKPVAFHMFSFPIFSKMRGQTFLYIFTVQ